MRAVPEWERNRAAEAVLHAAELVLHGDAGNSRCPADQRNVDALERLNGRGVAVPMADEVSQTSLMCPSWCVREASASR